MIRLGVVGYGRRAAGWISGSLRPVAAAAGEEIRVVGVVDPDEAGARGRLAPEDAKTGFFDTLPVMVGGTRPDALLIAPRCDLHAGYAVQAAALDLPVFLEKPAPTVRISPFRITCAGESASFFAAPSLAMITVPSLRTAAMAAGST